MGAFNFVGTIASGWLTDRHDPRKLLLIYYAFRGVSLLFLPFVHDSMGIMAFSILFGLDYIATVPPTVALVADAFGRQNVGHRVRLGVRGAPARRGGRGVRGRGRPRERRRLRRGVRGRRLDRDHRRVRGPRDPSPRAVGRAGAGGRGMSKRKRKSLGQAMGAAIVGFDYQVFRATKPPPELVEQGKPLAPVAAADGGRLSIDSRAGGARPEARRTDEGAAAGPDDSDAAALDDSSPANEPDPSETDATRLRARASCGSVIESTSRGGHVADLVRR